MGVELDLWGFFVICRYSGFRWFWWGICGWRFGLFRVVLFSLGKYVLEYVGLVNVGVDGGFFFFSILFRSVW